MRRRGQRPDEPHTVHADAAGDHAALHADAAGSSVADRVRRASPRTVWLVAGENVAYSQGTPRNQVKDAWLVGWHESPVHCRNQLNPVFNSAGVSVGIKAGRFVGVVVFGQKAGA